MGNVSFEQWQRFTALADRFSSEELAELIKKLEGMPTTPRSIQKLIQQARKVASGIEHDNGSRFHAFWEIAQVTHDLSDLNAALSAARQEEGHPDNRLLSTANIIDVFVDSGYVEQARSAASTLDPSRKARAFLKIAAKTLAETDFAAVRRIASNMEYPRNADVLAELLTITNNPDDHEKATRTPGSGVLLNDDMRQACARRYLTLARYLNHISNLARSRMAAREIRNADLRAEMLLEIARYTQSDSDFEEVRRIVEERTLVGHTIISLADATLKGKDIEAAREYIRDRNLSATSFVQLAKITKLDSDIDAARKKASTEGADMDAWRAWLGLAKLTHVPEDIEAARNSAESYPSFRCETFAAIYKLTRDPKDLREARQMIAKMTREESDEYLLEKVEGYMHIVKAMQNK